MIARSAGKAVAAIMPAGARRVPSLHRMKSRFTKQEVSISVSRQESRDLFLYSMPIVNLLYDVLGDISPPSVDHIRDIMTLFGLVSALMLSVVTQLSSTMDYDSLVACRERFSQGGTYHDPALPGYQPVDEILLLMTISFLLFMCCSLGTTFVLFALSTGADQLSNFRTRLHWWSSARWAFLACFAMLLTGGATTAKVYNRFVQCNLPDPYWEDAIPIANNMSGSGTNATAADAADVRARPTSSGWPAKTWLGVMAWCCIALLFIVVFIMGIAHRSLSIYLAYGLELSRAAINQCKTPKRPSGFRNWNVIHSEQRTSEVERGTSSRSTTMSTPGRASFRASLKASMGSVLSAASRPAASRARTSSWNRQTNQERRTSTDALKRFLERIHGGDIPVNIRRNVHRSLLQRIITLEDLVACEDDDLIATLLVDTAVFDGLMGPTYRWWFQCALKEERRRQKGSRWPQSVDAVTSAAETRL